MRRKVATGLGLLLWTALAGCGQTAGQSGGGWYAVDAAANSDGSTGPVDDGAADAGDSGATDDDATPADDATGPGEDATAGSDTEDDAADSAEPADSAVASDVADVAGAVDSGPVADADAAADTKDASVATDSGSGADAKDVADTLDAVSPADTAGGGDTKDAVVLQDSGPVADSGPAGDASADAAKDSAADSGDAGGDTTTPPPPGIPYLANFACGAGAGGWVLDKPSSGSKAVWAIDATPAQPAAPGDGCSLNFNDGAGFACTSSFYATATSPAIDASKVAPGTTLVLRFALAGTWPSDFTANLAVKASGDGSNYKFLAGPDAPGLTWKTQAFDVSAFAGGKLWLQFVFYTTNCSAPVGTGPFIDALEVVPLGCVAAKCDDGNVCSQDGCDLAGDACSHVDQPAAACEDGSACTVGDFCLDLQCISGVGPYCSDGNPCTSDGCDAKGCVYTPLDCNDGNLCTTDSCGAGGCSHAAKVCDDKNPCTADACVNGSCTAAPASGPCSDGNPCTGPDTCSGGQCQAGPASGCDDGNVCTSDACVGGTCTATPSSGPCSDGNACTGPDACSSGACKAGAATNCDDGDACTTDACSATSGVCSHTPGGLCGKPAKTLPYSMKFGCTDPELAAWTATGTPGGPSFAFDANPAWYPFTGYHSYGCSANFNNGNTYECPPNFTTLGVSGALTSPILNGSSVPAGSKLWVSAWLAGDFGYDDKVELQGSTDGSTWVTIRSWDADQLFDTAWRQFIDPLDDYVGTSFQLRWKFTGGDCYQNNKLGVFIDDVSVYVAPPCAQGEPYNTAEVIPAYTMGASLPYKLDPPLYTGSTNQVAKASWHVAGVPNKFVTVKVEFSGAGQASVCVQHVCDGSPPCSIACPAGTYANATKTGCCTSNVDSDTITFTPTGSGANSGTTTVFAVATAPVCQEVQVKAKF